MINLSYIKKFIYDIKDITNEVEGELYLVGGYVRDKLMSITSQPKDADFVFKGDIHKLIEKLQNEGYKFFPIKENINIYRCVKNENKIDVALMKGNSIEEDLKNRDFTINAIALRLGDNKIIDPFYGKRALQNRIIKNVTDRSLEDDPCRILRGIRFCISFGMHFNLETEESVEKFKGKIMDLPKERVFSELMLIIENDKQGRAFEILDNYAILKHIIPYIEESKTIGKCKYHVEDVFTHLNLTYGVFKDVLNGKINFQNLDLDDLNTKIGEFRLREYVALACFLHDIGKYEAYTKTGDKVSFHDHEIKGAVICRNFSNYMKLPKKATRYIENIVEGHMYPLALFTNRTVNKKEAFYKFFHKYDGYVIEIIITAFCDNCATKMLLEIKDENLGFKEFIEDMLKEYKLYCNISATKILSGEEVIEILVKSGPQVKTILEDIHRMRYLGKINSREEALDYLKLQTPKTYI
ncbi:HDIG domain-containing metalloprotein [Clostridium sp. WILCCON 0269]|uniref:HDIG domain-containing metalloprotein n=1 Tax=Candidatus Clostridium eludens TaxID=3381663 RepID=A0ABW8SHX7_9CLOT